MSNKDTKHIEEIRAYNNQTIDCKVLESKGIDSINSKLYFMGIELTGGTESNKPYNECFFGELDSKDSNLGLDTLKPIYHLQASDEIIESTSNNRDSINTESNNSLSTLDVFLNGSRLTLLNYSLLDSSLNIKLECNSKESKEILEREQIQREQKEQDSKTQDSIQSTALLHPILEDNEIKCPHNGVVKLKSNKGKSFTSKGIPLVLESDLLNAPIIGCTNNIAGIPTPCTSVSVILPSSRGLKKFNDDYPIMQDLVSSGVMSDKGFPLTCTPKENTFRINSPNPTQANNQTKESLLSHIQLTKPILRLHYKIHSHQKDNLPIYRIKCNDTLIESHNDTPLDSLSIDIAKDTKILDDTQSLDSNLQDILSSIYTSLKDTYAKDYKYHYLSLQLDSNALILILLIPQSIPKVYKELYKDYTYKDYGIGKYHYLYNYCTHTMLEIADYTQVGLAHNPSNATILTLHTPYKAQRLELQLANGLDSILESKDREQNLDSLLTLKLINGGYKEKYWSFGEEVEEEIEEKIDISQGILIASNDDAIAYQALEEMNKKVRLFFYGGARNIGDNAAFYYASLNVVSDYKRHYPDDTYIHMFVDSAKTIVDTINAQKLHSIASLDLFFHGSKWGLYIYKGSSMSRNLSLEDVGQYNLNAGLYASKTTSIITATDVHEDKRTIYDIKFDRFITQNTYIEIHGCESGGDLYIIDSITKNLSEEIPHGYVVGHITKANPNIDNTKDTKKQDYRHGKRAIWQNGKVIKETTQKRWINLGDLL